MFHLIQINVKTKQKYLFEYLLLLRTVTCSGTSSLSVRRQPTRFASSSQIVEHRSDTAT